VIQPTLSASTVDTATAPEHNPSLEPGGIPGEASRTTLQWLRMVHTGEVVPSDIPPEVRRECIEQLTLQGFSAADIAEMFHISERTVRREREAVRNESTIAPDLQLGDRLLGEYERWTLASLQRLARLAHDASAPAYARLWAEEALSRNYQRLIQTADKLGYIEHGDKRRTDLRLAAKDIATPVPLPDLSDFLRPLTDQPPLPTDE
jgi:hypothetical protein